MIYEYWLGGDGHSKRAIRYRLLTPNEVDRIAKEAASGGAGMLPIEYHNRYMAIGSARMLVAMTEPLKSVPQPPNEKGEPQPDKDPDLDDPILWNPIDPTTMELSFSGGTIFTAKDVNLISLFFKGLHEVNLAEAHAAMGKVRRREK